MANNKQIKTRLQQLHGYEVDWIKAGNNSGFVPLEGEEILYMAETAETELPEGRSEPIVYNRKKIGDGINNINDLPFESNVLYVEQQLTEEQKQVARENIDAASQDEAKAIIRADILPTDNIEAKFYVKLPKATLGYKHVDGSFDPKGHSVDCSVMKDFLDPVEALPGFDMATGRWHMYYCMADKNVYVNITEQLRNDENIPIVADCPLGWQLVNDFGRNGKYVTSSTSIFYLQGVAHSIEEMEAPAEGIYYYILLEENSDLLYNVYGDWKTVVTQDKAISVEISETPKDGEILVYDATANKLVNSGFTFETLFDKIHKMIDDYMNTSITNEPNDAGGVTQSVEAPADAITTSTNEAGGETLNIGG